MPFEIIRDNIVNVRADAIVNTANANPVVGSGVDSAIHEAAGPRLLKARQAIGSIPLGCAAITPAFDLKAQYVIHAVGPVWLGGDQGEADALRLCYENSLKLAWQHRCKSIAFPLISTGSFQFPKPLALRIAIQAFSAFLLEHDMRITLVVFNRDAYQLSGSLFASVASYIDDTYVEQAFRAEYAPSTQNAPRDSRLHRTARQTSTKLLPRSPESTAPLDAAFHIPAPSNGQTPDFSRPKARPFAAPKSLDLDAMLREQDMGFSNALMQLIDKTGKKDSEIYKKANIDRKLFSKIRKPTYKPSKPTAIALAIALELDLEQTRQLIARAGYALSHSSKFDIIIEYFLLNRIYDIFEINATLFKFDQSLLGAT